MTRMGKHRRPGPTDQPSRAIPRPRTDDSTADGGLEEMAATYERRRRPPLDLTRRHLPLHGHGAHVQPDQPRLLQEWDGFAFTPAGTADNLAAAQQWVNAPHATEDH